VAMESTENRAVPFRTVLVFGLAEYVYMLFMNTVTSQMNYYATDVLLIPAAVAGAILVMGKVIEVASAPAVGLMIEKVKLPWGKYRSWIFVASFPFAIFHALVFFGGEFHFSGVWPIVFFSTCLVIGSLSGNVVQSVHNALVQGLTYVDQERKKLIRSKTAANYLAKAGTGFIGIQLISFFAAKTGKESAGFAIVLALMGVLLIIGYFVLGVSAKKHSIDTVEGDYGAKEMLGMIARNKPLLCAFGSFFMKSGAYFTVTGLVSYYFKYVVGDFSKLSLFFTITNIAALCAVAVSNYFFLRVSNKKGFMVALGTMFFSVLLARFCGNNYKAFIALLSAFAFADAFCTMYGHIHFSEAIDYCEYKNGLSLRGLSMSLFTLALDGSRILQQLVIALGFSIMGYTTREGLSLTQASTLMNMICLVPAAFLALGMFVLKQYELQESELHEYRMALERKETNRAPAN